MTATNEVDVEHYLEHGWIAPIEIMSEADAARLLAELEAAEAEYPHELHSEHRNNAHLTFPFLVDLAMNDRILDAVEPLVGPEILLWSTVLFIKEPGSSAYVSWHQDAFYMGLEPENFVTAWVALTPSNRDTGCVSVLPGTHRAVASHTDTFDDHNILTRGQTINDIDPSTAIDLVLRPGQMSLHHPWLVHGSQPNTSEIRRVGVAMQSYLGSDVRPLRGKHFVLPVRGIDIAPDGFETVAPPVEACDDIGRSLRAQANDALSSVLYNEAEQIRQL